MSIRRADIHLMCVELKWLREKMPQEEIQRPHGIHLVVHEEILEKQQLYATMVSPVKALLFKRCIIGSLGYSFHQLNRWLYSIKVGVHCLSQPGSLSETHYKIWMLWRDIFEEGHPIQRIQPQMFQSLRHAPNNLLDYLACVEVPFCVCPSFGIFLFEDASEDSELIYRSLDRQASRLFGKHCLLKYGAKFWNTRIAQTAYWLI